MPGLHTFYDGSRVLEPLADVVGFEVDKVMEMFITLFYNENQHYEPKSIYKIIIFKFCKLSDEMSFYKELF